MHPSSTRFTMPLSQGSVSTFYQALCPMMVSSFRQSLYREPLRLRQVLPPLSTGFEPVSPGVTPALSLILAHAPDQNPLTASILPLYHEPLQVAARPCWKSAFPSVISVNLSLDAWTHTPVVPSGALTRFFPRGQRPSPRREWLGTQQSIRTATSVRSGFSGLQSFANVQASRFARHPGCSYRIKVSPIRAAVAFTSTHISVCYLPEQWIC